MKAGSDLEFPIGAANLDLKYHKTQVFCMWMALELREHPRKSPN